MKNLEMHLTIKNFIILTVLVVFGTIISCSPSQKESNPEQVQQQIQALQIIVEPEIQEMVIPVQENETTEAEQTVETVMLNPPHGEPFHRCDIPVGSPLNTAAPAISSATVNGTEISPTAGNTANVNNAQAINTAAPKLNPPHGEPFHRCDIPVGSPLTTAAPYTTSTNTSPTIQRTGTTPTIENAARLNNSLVNNSTAPTLANSTAPKLNPPHGQPFHLCEIPVGSPLPVN